MSTNSSLILRTGLQGNGKTLNTIKELDEQAFNQFRPVFYHNVTGLKPDLLKADWFEFDDPLAWFELPQDAIIVIDEAQGDIEHQRFGVRDPRKAVPLHISRLETMRKQGHELNLITQDPRFIDVHARRLCNCHIHYWRAFGSSQIVRFVMPRVKDDVEKINSFKGCEKSIVKLDKKMFDVYESAQAKHHFKFKVPKAAWVLLVCAAFAGLAIYKVSGRFTGEAETAPSTASQDQGVISSIASNVLGPGAGQQKPKLDYFEQLKPRIADIPSSAPIYDELTKPVSIPKTYCVMTSDEQLINRNFDSMAVSLVKGKQVGCQCYTQQNTRLSTSFAYCLDVVQNGRYDYTVADRGSIADAAKPLANPQQSLSSSQPSTALFSKPESIVTVVPDGEFAARPWH